jgi:hypothetical protein
MELLRSADEVPHPSQINFYTHKFQRFKTKDGAFTKILELQEEERQKLKAHEAEYMRHNIDEVKAIADRELERASRPMATEGELWDAIDEARRGSQSSDASSESDPDKVKKLAMARSRHRRALGRP